ncbi:Vomp family autotransporter [Bartonella tribocorum]|uniref:Surface protein/Bartonella adhesin n=1 Tax=Bartonella tribocorum TaxID=85701 RepID=A0A2M6UW42_9HYPH|nr:Vomp family autotransporter [Bartonella tribocorum]PIT70425.1 hypothetical protein CEV08_04000 [Bartonella tribocorum]
MKKKYSTPNLIKAVSLSAAMATLLSSVSPVVAANLSIRGSLVQSTTGTGVSYTKGSHGSIVLAGDDDYCGVDNVIGRGGEQQQKDVADSRRIPVKEQYERFLHGYNAQTGGDPYGTTIEQVTWLSDGKLSKDNSYMGKASTDGSMNVLPEAYGVYSFATGCGSSATGNYSTAFGAGATAKTGGSQAFGVSALASGKATVAIGIGSEASGEAAVAFGGLATASGKSTVAVGAEAKAEKNYAIAIGAEAEAKAAGSIAIGGRRSDRTEESNPNRKVIAKGENAIAIGSHTYAEKDDTVAIGANAHALVADGVAIGGGSVSSTAKDVKGYDPATGKETTKTDMAWKSTAGAFSVGEVGGKDNGKITRQITGVAAGKEDTDAVNVAQLKAMRNVIAGGGAWKLSANDESPTDVNPGNTVDFSVKSEKDERKDNLKIAKNTEGTKHKIEFTLNDNLKLTSITTGQSTMSDDGFIFKDGAKITIDGIDAGNQKITKVADATEDTDAVNYKQLQEVKNATKTSWQLSVNGGNATAIGPNGTVNFQSVGNEGAKNINITKDESHNVTFDLADDINVMSVTAGESVMDAAGFRFNGGPSITVTGIHAGDKTIKGVADGVDNTDAVNFGQLQKYVAKNGVSWKLSVNGQNATDVKAGNTVDLVAGENEGGNKNIKIAKNNNKVIFSLNDALKLTSVTAGNSIMDNSGFGFIDSNGPKITLNGIDAGNKKITKVADGADDTDAVNYKQLKALEQVATQGWKLSVNGGNATDVKAGNTVDFVAVKHHEGAELTNIKIVKGDNNEIKFDLEDFIKVGSIKVGDKTTLTDNGLKILGGPSVTFGGILAGHKTISAVADGVLDKDAVNVSQLKTVEKKIKEVAENTLVTWEEDQKLITIGKQKGGTKIDITGTDGERIVAGVKDGEISESSKEAINGSQINKISGDIAKSFGGDAAFQNGAFVGPRYNLSTVSTDGKVEQKVFENVGDALTGLDANVKNVNSRLTYVDNKFDKFSQDALLWNDGKQAFVALHGPNGKKTESKITSLLDGDIKEDSTDAINGSQIHSMGSDIAKFFGGNTEFKNGIFTEPRYNLTTIDSNGGVEQKEYNSVGDALSGLDTNIRNVNHHFIISMKDIASYFGGGAGYDEKGEWHAPTFNVYTINDDGSTSKQPYHNVADAFEGVNNTFTNIHNQISDIKENNLVQQEEKSGPITIGAKTGGGIINIANNEGSVRIISGVSGGKVTEDSTEAVNGAQLFETNGAIQELYDNFDDMNTNISNYFGGNADVLSGVAPTYVIQGNKHNDVGSAFSAVDTSITNIHNQISDITKNSLVKWDETNKFITIGAEKEGVEINISNKDEKPRVISGVREGLYDDEAVNVAQLKEVKELAKNGWKLSVNGNENNVTDVKAGSTVDFSVKDTSKKGVGKDNLKIEKDDKNKVTFSLNDNLKLTSVTTDNSTMSDDGFIIKNGPHMTKDGIFVSNNNGPSMTTEGIDAGKKVITNVAEGKNDNDAVNFSQLQGIKNQIENNSLVKWEEDQKLITIGKEKGGTEIRIANKDGQERTLSGVKDGMISQASKEAINGSQIDKISKDIAKFFGGGAKFVDGAFKGLKYTLSAIVDGELGKANFYDVGSALTGLDSNVKDVNQRLTKVSNEFNQKIEGISKDALLWDDKEQAFVARHEKDGKKTNSKLKYLLDGDIAKGSTDAITGNQLYLMSNKLANYFGGGAKYENGKWADPTFKIVQVDANGKTVETEHHNVADAFGDVNKNMSNINNRINDVINKVDSDALKWNDKEKAYDANHDGKPSKIINVADGKIEKGSKDAVNGGQLWKTNERVTNVENRVISVEKDVKHLNNRVDNISNTIEDIGGEITNIDNKINTIAEDAVRYDRDENGKKTNKITLVGGDASEPVVINNVADGKIEKGSKEAVNGGQLHDYTKEQMKIVLDESKHYTDQRIRNITIDAIDDAVDRSKQYTDMKFDALNYSIENVRKEARQAAAIGLAVSNLRYNDTPGKLSVGFGTGLWRSQSAFAFGAGYTSEKGNIRSNVSVTTSGGHWGVGAGFNMTLN